MNFRKRFAVFFVIFFSLFSSLSAKNANISTLKGISLSNHIYSCLKNSNVTPSTQALINNGINSFPYNIYTQFPSKKESSKNLILVFSQEQVVSEMEIIQNLLNNIKNEDYECNITVLFSYGDKQKIEKQFMIYGSDVFFNSLNTNEDYTGIIFDLENDKNIILTSSNGYISPSWLIRNEYNIYLKENLNKNLPFYYVSQIYKMSFFKDRELECLLQNNIPGIKLCLNKNTISNDSLYNIIINSIKEYDIQENRNWENHFLLINFLDHYIHLTESAIIRIIIILIFTWLLYVFILGFVNLGVKHSTWQKFKKIWYSIPLTFGLSYVSFIGGQLLFNVIGKSFTTIQTIYFCCTLQIGIAFLFATLFYLFILLFNFKFSENSLDFLIVVVCFINQAIFILIDISLFPVFFIFFALSILSYYIKNNGVHIAMFFLMIFALVPYANAIITNGNPNIVYQYILNKHITSVTCSLSIYPIFLMYFRILTSVRNYFRKIRSLIIFNFSSYVFIITMLTVFSAVRSNNLDKKYAEQTTYIINQSEEEKIFCRYNDNFIFTDIIRTIEIDIKDDPEVCEVRINSMNGTPVLYSDNEYDHISQTSVIFKVPDNPPSHLSFTYGASNEPCNIVINALYPIDNDKGKYDLVTKVLSIGEN